MGDIWTPSRKKDHGKPYNSNVSARSKRDRNDKDDDDDDEDDEETSSSSNQTSNTTSNSTATTSSGTATTMTTTRPNSRLGPEPTYFLGGSNGTTILEEILNGYGWRRIRERNDEFFKLKWCELKASIDYATFREGEQLVNHIPNCELLTNKEGLLNSLQEYCKISAANHRQPTKMDFLPETYKVDDPKDKEKFLATYQEDEIWICKPTGRNQGKGIFLIWNSEDCYKAVTHDPASNPSRFKPFNRIIQRYIFNPLLINNRKFDIRCYMLIANTNPFVVLYHKGYIRLSMYNYDKNCDNILTHLTNQYIQKKDPKYGERKEETVWSMDKFNDYVNRNFAESKNIGQNWVYNALTERMKSIILICFNSVKNKLQRRLGYFELYGLDFLVDENMKVWLIEINMNPSLTVNCEALKDVIPGLLKETLDISIECFEKSRRRKPILPINSRKNFELIYSPHMFNAANKPQNRSISVQKKVGKISITSDRTKNDSNFETQSPFETEQSNEKDKKLAEIKNDNSTKQNNNSTAIILQNLLRRQKILQECKSRQLSQLKSSENASEYDKSKSVNPILTAIKSASKVIPKKPTGGSIKSPKSSMSITAQKLIKKRTWGISKDQTRDSKTPPKTPISRCVSSSHQKDQPSNILSREQKSFQQVKPFTYANLEKKNKSSEVKLAKIDLKEAPKSKIQPARKIPSKPVTATNANPTINATASKLIIQKLLQLSLFDTSWKEHSKSQTLANTNNATDPRISKPSTSKSYIGIKQMAKISQSYSSVTPVNAGPSCYARIIDKHKPSIAKLPTKTEVVKTLKENKIDANVYDKSSLKVLHNSLIAHSQKLNMEI